MLGPGICGFAATEVQRKLREKNEVLQQAVTRGSAALQQQGEELNRARDIQEAGEAVRCPRLSSPAISAIGPPTISYSRPRRRMPGESQ